MTTLYWKNTNRSEVIVEDEAFNEFDHDDQWIYTKSLIINKDEVLYIFHMDDEKYEKLVKQRDEMIEELNRSKYENK